MVQFIELTGPASWASYLINGDDSGLEEGESEKADAWLKREGAARVVSDVEDSERFTWSMRLHCPELDCEGGTVLDYIAEPA